MDNKNLSDQIIEDVFQKEFQHNLQNYKHAQKLRKDIVHESKIKIDQQFQKKLKQIEANRRIRRSAAINKSRMRRAETKFKFCEQIFKQVQNQLQIFMKENRKDYQYILITLIVQGVIRLFQENCFIRCLPQDIQQIREIINDCIVSYNHIMKQQIGRQYKLNIQINQTYPLAQRNLSKEAHLPKKLQDSECIGGIILTDTFGNIIYKNTIDARVNIIRQLALPDIRKMLWN